VWRPALIWNLCEPVLGACCGDRTEVRDTDLDAAEFTDLRRGFQGLSSNVVTALEQAPFSGHAFVFRGKRGDLNKLLCLMAMAFVFFRSGWSADGSSGHRQRVEQCH
jgi:transposase